MEDNLFYVAQKAFIEKDGKILVLLKKDSSISRLDYPGGKFQDGEIDIHGSLIREVLEETKLQIEVNDPFYTWIFTLPETHKNHNKTVFVVGYKCKYLGGELTISDEHSDYVWVNKDDYQELNDRSVFFEPLTKYFR